MPYGLKNETPEQTKWLESCVNSVLEKNPKFDKGKAIMICKSQLKKKGTSEISIREYLNKIESKVYEKFNSHSVPSETNVWVSDIFDDYVVLEKNNAYFKVPYTVEADGGVEIKWEDMLKVEKITSYEPSKEESTVANRRETQGNILR